MSQAAPTIIVTRPVRQATTLLAQLQAAGWPAWALPTLDIQPLHEPAAQTRLHEARSHLADYDLVILVSPNAIHMALQDWPGPWPVRTALAVLGPGSVAALATLGLRAPSLSIYQPAATRLDSEGLWSRLQEAYGQNWQDRRVLLLRGAGGREWLADTLRQAGAKVDSVACYQRVQPVLSVTQRAQLQVWQAACAAVIWLLTSSEGTHNLAQMLAADPDLWQWAIRQPVLVAHPRIEAAARTLGFIDIHLHASGDAALLETLRQLQLTNL